MLKKNDEIQLTVKSCTVQGSGVCDYNGMTVFVRGAVTGDHVIAHIIKVKKTYAVGIIKKITQRSPIRIKPQCAVSEKCGGCCFAHISYDAELEIKQKQVEDNFRRIGGLDVTIKPIIPSPDSSRYRNKAQYPVGSDGKFASIGFYAPMTHRIIDCADCYLQPEDFKKVVDIFRDWIRERKISVYDEVAHKGILRHIYLRKGFVTGEIMVCLVANSRDVPFTDELIETLKAEVEGLRSVILNVNTKNTNVVLGSECITLYGSDYITDELCGLKFNISPLSFYQVNHDGAEILYNKAKEYAALTGKESLIDLYCGTGTIGLTMAREAGQLVGVEIIEQAVENAKKNAELNGIENSRFICGDASKAAEILLQEGIKPDVVILDPPRKGCDGALVETVSKMSPERIVYVSCDSATLARDCARFLEEGYKVEEATPVDMFPRTGNVETVVLLSQRRPDTHIDIKLDLSELDITSAETKATYQEIKDYVLDKHGLKVSTLYISQVKAKCGIIERENYNKGKEGHRVPKCPKEKEEAIMDALIHFNMI
ncbi:MAG: 23S rRNA (uracil(1939)-C(5))-methyltransferase RlmD [Acutalibacteraceae bacterium]|nr:23S rRNA (uracil(1939)-C(5))-methyltransferase RlmD [Acutalibacteraceae bacterium]